MSNKNTSGVDAEDARQAHNLEDAGSNPAPATNELAFGERHGDTFKYQIGDLVLWTGIKGHEQIQQALQEELLRMIQEEPKPQPIRKLYGKVTVSGLEEDHKALKEIWENPDNQLFIKPQW